jgi:hypothetical protein
METITPSEWYVPIIVLGIVVLIVAFSGRPTADIEIDIDEAEEPDLGAALIDRLQRKLGIGIVVESIEATESTASTSLQSGDPEAAVTIRATLIFGGRATSVVVAGPSETAAWRELARAAIAWRNDDHQHIPMWPGGGG